MSYVAKGEKEYDATGAPVPGAKIHKIRITLTSSNVRNLEKCTLHRLTIAVETKPCLSQSLPTLSTGLKTNNFVSRVPSVFPPSR
jgi:hypothetical protein